MTGRLACVVLAAVAALAVTARAATPRFQIVAAPKVVTAGTPVTLFGVAPGGDVGERVDIEGRECGRRDFRLVSGAVTTGGGIWHTVAVAFRNTTFRARFGGALSPAVRVKSRLPIVVRRLRRNLFRVEVAAPRSFAGRRVALERRRGTAWLRVRTGVLRRVRGRDVATLRVGIPRGVLVRAVMPQSQVGRCYVASYSRTIRS